VLALALATTENEMTILVELALVVGGGAVVWLAWHSWTGRRRQRADKGLQSDGVIAIVDSRHVGLFSKLEKLETQTSISQNTFVQVKDALDQLDRLDQQKEVHLVLHTMGGSLSAAEAICRRLLLARGRGTKIYAYVPYFAYSAGCMIASACNEIRMSESAFLGPADAQVSSLLQSNSIKSICETVEFQLEHCKDKIKSDWYSKYVEAKATRERQRKWIDELVQRGIYEAAAGDSIYEELFAGKYNHDQVIHPEWARKIGLPVAVVEMPEFVARTLQHYNAMI